MNKLKNTILYLVKRHPPKRDLTQTRLTMLLFLIDWENTLQHREQITELSWYFGQYGPNAIDLIPEIRHSKNLYIAVEKSNFGTDQFMIKTSIDKSLIQIEKLSTENIKIIDDIINKTKNFSWKELLDYTYNTKPIKLCKKYTTISFKDYIWHNANLQINI